MELEYYDDELGAYLPGKLKDITDDGPIVELASGAELNATWKELFLAPEKDDEYCPVVG